MRYASTDEIHGVLIQVGTEHLLLPNATIAEVLVNEPVEPIDDMPSWLVGTIAWYGWKVPLLSFPVFSAQTDELKVEKNKIVVLKALGNEPSLPYFALLTASFPHLVSVPRDGMLADASEDALPRGVHMRVLLSERSALLPDLESMEAAILAAYAEIA
jgi:chemosensory pili system protein ChpC